MNKKTFLCALILFIGFTGHAQKHNNIWYFGNHAGLDFNSGVPVPLTNGQLITTEGCASVADNNGSLLFYTDGVTVYNSSHVAMPNGTGLFGGNSSSQSALIIQQPGSNNLYYIFTVPDQGSVNGFCYSVVDMTLQGGLGDITSKNVLLHTPVTEKLFGTRHQNGTDYWVVVHEAGTDAFYSYQFSGAGVNPTPVISNTGLIHGSAIGYLKIANDGSKLVISINASNEVELFDFNNLTGTVSNPLTFPTIYIQPYGLEFSPDNSKLYVAEAGNQGGPVNIYQFDLQAGTPAAILASAISIGSSSNSFLGPLQTGPDCKIYAARYQTGYIGVINDPNQSGIACNFNDTGVYLGGQICTYGLPNQISTCNGGASVSGTCLGDSTFFSVQATGNLLGTQWDFDDPASGLYNQAFVFNPVHYFSSPGVYQVQLIKFYTTFTDTVIIPVTIKPVPVVSLGPDTGLCAGNSIQLNAGSGFSSWQWQDNTTDSVLLVSLPGTYWVTVSLNGCYGSDTILVAQASCIAPVVSFISSDTVFCDKKCLDFTDLSTNSPTSWLWLFPGAVPLTDTVQHPVNICYNAYGTFDVTLIACNAAGCDTLFVPALITEYQIPAQPVITQSNDTLYCTPAYTYAWYDALNPGVIVSSSSFFTTSSGGSYFVIVADSLGCQNASAVFTATGLIDFAMGEDITAFPVPSGNVINIWVHDRIFRDAINLKIISLTGQLVSTHEYRVPRFIVDVDEIANDTYIIQLILGDRVYHKKITIHH